MGLTYKDAGVDKEAGYKQVGLIKDIVKSTYREGVMSHIGGFAGLFNLDTNKYKDPVLVSGTDGVGTKLKIGFLMDKHDSLGQDCVAMCVNDILCQGAEPLFFLDYIATGKLIPEKMAAIVEGVAKGCREGQMALIGGETAEMPGFYKEDEYDIAGFAVGVVNKEDIITGEKLGPGDILIGLKSSGIHSNGYSLVRKIVFEKMGLSLDEYIEDLGRTLGEELLEPTRIYVKTMLPLIEKYEIKAISHITGGGFYENIPRMLKEGLEGHIDKSKIETPAIFNLLQTWGGLSEKEMYSTFNMGIGMVFAVSKEDLEPIEKDLIDMGEDYVVLGQVKEGDQGVVLCQ